ncbi:MAG: ScyD/ScyE family protein [Chloroflexota bacterium]|nr:ScyD/ScyE family protein [Chloroflexota bacterium]
MRSHNRLMKWVLTVLLVVTALALALPVLAQDGPPPLPGEVVVGELNAPRGIAFDDDGNLIVAVAGSGGDVEMVLSNPEGESTMRLGMSGEIISVAPDGAVSDVIAGFPSYASPMETTGLYRAIPHDNSLWVLFSGSGPVTTGAFWMDTIAEIDMTTLATVRVINLNNYETVNDPDGRGYDSNVADVAWGADGTLYIVDAGMNALLSWTEADGLATVQSWGNDVPTSIEVADDASFYIGFLGEGIAPGVGKVEHWADGELVHTYAGLTGVTDILLAGDTLYAVQLFLFGEQGPGPGNVVMLTEEAATPVAEGIPAPFALAMDADGALYVSFGTIAFAPGMTGGVLKLDVGM